MAVRVDQKQRDRIRKSLDRNMVVEAAAGTGKTTELVRRIVAVLSSGRARVDSIVAVTFTEKAAGELKLRMRAALEEARQQAAAGSKSFTHLEDALARLEEARVGTIHAFCADLLRERSVEAQVDPRFETMTESEAERLFRRAFDMWLQEKLAKPPEGVRRSLRRSTRGPGPPSWWARETPRSSPDEGPVGRLRRAGWTLAAWRDFPAAWRRDPFDRMRRVDELASQLHEFTELAGRCARPERDNFFLDTRAVRQCGQDARAAEEVRPRDYDGLEASFVELAQRRYEKPRKGYGTRYGDGVSRHEVHEAYNRLHAALRDFARAADADLAALLHAELQEAVDRYERLKERTGRLDFVDLLIRARDLVRDREDVRTEFQQRFTHLFVDEFQDTDPLQAELLLLLAAQDPQVTDWRDVNPCPGKLFLVADPKQSIYRFRRADLGTYLEVKALMERHGAECVHLTTSFRAVPSIQHAVNTAFAAVMDGDREAQQAHYVPLSAFRKEPGDQPALVALPVPRPYGKRSVTKEAIDRTLPDAVAAFVEWLIHDSGWHVSDRDNPRARVPVAARHCCILLRRFDSFFMGDVTRGYVRALEARGLRHLLVGGRSFHEREEVETLRTALTAIEWPDDELSVFATLHGSLFAIGDEELLEYRQRFRRLHPFRVPRELRAPSESVDSSALTRLSPIVEALELLARLHRQRNEQPIAETIQRLLETTRAHAGFALHPSGEQVLANVLHIAEQARGYEREGGISFRGFVERLEEDAAGRRVTEAPILEEGSDGVRIMTVHKAKGLEFPVVILADMTANITPFRASRWIDPVTRLCAQRVAGWTPAELIDHEEEELRRDAAEGVRIAYVAATRARDLLVVPAVGDGPACSDGWISPLNAAIYPPKPTWTNAFAAPGVPEFGNDTVLERPFDLALDAHSVRPGRHTLNTRPTRGPAARDAAAAGTIASSQYDVVWWDPALLRLDVPAAFGIRQEELLGKDADVEQVDSDAARYDTWTKERAAVLERASTPTLRVQTATERARRHVLRSVSEPGAPEPHVEILQLPIEAARPRGPRFGALVHSILAIVPLDATPDRVDGVTDLQTRILGATPAESAAARHAVSNVLRHPLLERARSAAASGNCRRETPVTHPQSDGTLVEGVVDLAFQEDGSWIVVDFKTDHELDQQLSVYKHQVSIYAAAIAAVTGQPTRSILMRV